ncbi:formyltetrahydrofolate deformylase [bacterium]|nr:MAG: formyltetrahydrofolate deformylase [bacterium]
MLVSCPDRPGIVAAVSRFLFEQGANLVHADQHTTHAAPRRFFLRVEFEGVPAETLAAAFAPVADTFGMEARFVDAERRKRLAIFVSKEDHCLRELLWEIEAGDIQADVACVIGNHEGMRGLTEGHGASFHHVPVLPESKEEAEARQLGLCAGADLIILARYMQIVSPAFLAEWPNRVINIHHSFLPAFVGANPYRQAFQRGVKLIGATAHYVTSELDAGPILEQDVARVEHRDEVAELRRLGRQLERSVLARAVRWHCEDRVLVDGNRTVVFR